MERGELWYLACPFRHEDAYVQRKRCAAAHYITAQLFLQGKRIFSPLTHNETLIDILQDALPGEQWLQFDLHILAICQKLCILKMEGWEISKGVQREILFAQSMKIPIEEIEPPCESAFIRFIKGNV